MDINSSTKLSAIRTPLIFIVVLSHVNNIYNDIDSLKITVDIITKSVVPCFFLISGYFFLKEKSLSMKLYKEKIYKRSKSLFIPYLIWNILPLLVPITLCLCTSILTTDLSKFQIYLTEIINNESYNPISLFWKNKVNGDSFYPANFPLWYIRDLMLIIIVSPILYVSLKIFNIYFLLLCFILFLIGIPFSNILLFFSIGMFLSLNNIDIISLSKKHTVIILFLYISLFYLVFKSHDSITTKVCMFLGVFSLFSLINMCPSKIISVFYNLSKYSFFIYAIHAIYIYRLDDIIYNFVPNNLIFHIISYVSVAIISCLIGILIYRILKVLSPKTLSILCGSRI